MSEEERSTERITERYDIDHSSQEISAYDEVYNKRRDSEVSWGIFLMLLLIAATINLFFPYLPFNEDNIFMISIIAVVIFVLLPKRIVSPHLQIEEDSPVTNKSFTRYKFNEAIDQYNQPDSDYSEVLDELNEIRTHEATSWRHLTNHSSELRKYVRALRKQEDPEEDIRETFPVVVESIIREQKEYSNTKNELRGITERLQPETSEPEIPSTWELRRELLLDFVHSPIFFIGVVSIVIIAVLSVFFFIDTELAKVLAGLSAFVGLVLNYMDIV